MGLIAMMTQLTATYDYDGRRFAPAGHPDGGDPAAGGALAEWRQDGDVVKAFFAGGSLRAGFLAGTVDADGAVDAAYCQVVADGTVQAGRCTSTPLQLADGRLRMREELRRIDGSTGVSFIEEVAFGPADLEVPA
jgi:hypothetical protein